MIERWRCRSQMAMHRLIERPLPAAVFERDADAISGLGQRRRFACREQAWAVARELLHESLDNESGQESEKKADSARDFRWGQPGAYLS